MTIKEVAGYQKLTDKTACRQAAEGKFPGFKWVVLGGFCGESDAWIEKKIKEQQGSYKGDY